MHQLDEGTFLDRLYAAPLTPALWVPVMEQFADMLGGSGAWLSRLSVADGTGTGIIARIDPSKPSLYLSHYAGVNPFSNESDPQRYVATWTPKIRFYEDWLPRDAVDRTEYYNDFLRPQDIYCSIMIGLEASGTDTCVLNINRTHARGNFEPQQVARARRLHGHWRRAFRLASRLETLERGAADLTAVLGLAGHAVLIVEADGRVRHANALAEQLVGPKSGLRLEFGRLTATQPAAARQLLGLLGNATIADAATRRGGSMAITHVQTGNWLAVAVDPLPDPSPSVFRSGRMAIVCITDPRARLNISEARLQEMFGLTPAEVRVACALMEGASPREAAERLGVRFQTVRNQLQSLYHKTMTSRQSELVLLLARVCAREPASPSSASGD